MPGATTSAIDQDGGAIATGETTVGVIDLRADTDAYTFSGQAEQTVIIQMSRASGKMNPRIDLFAPSGGAAEASAGTSDSDFGGSTALLQGHRLEESGQYTIAVRDFGANETGGYNLSLTILP